MLCEVLALANEHVALPASGGTCSLSDSVRDMAAYSKLTDSVFKYIELRTDVDELGPARALLHKIHTRQHHRYIGESVLSDSDAAREKSKQQWQQECAAAVVRHLRQLEPEDRGGSDPELAAMVRGVSAAELEVQVVKINYGKGAANPVDHCLFYGRDNEEIATKISATQVSAMIPTVFEERYLRGSRPLRLTGVARNWTQASGSCLKRGKESPSMRTDVPHGSHLGRQAIRMRCCPWVVRWRRRPDGLPDTTFPLCRPSTILS